ncbi:SUMF1/EgtB/PvdO family nonheme iron enzyme, partial [Myxococcota bacterium]|nr:SUMF1/EgtB/PvdO family nonheme iron enzyme [Myxococcota bacterium]
MKRIFLITMLASISLTVAGCDDDKSESCSAGAWGCECYDNLSCNYGLHCNSEQICDGPSPCDTDQNCTAAHRECIMKGGQPACGECTTGYVEDEDSCVADNLCLPNPCMGKDEVCDPLSGECACPESHCLIDGDCFADGETREDHGCQICNFLAAPDAWSLRLKDEVCRPSATDCDLAEKCDGNTTECPADTFLPEGSSCGSPVVTSCDGADSCDALGECLPNHRDTTLLCRPKTATCDAEDFCDGEGSCPEEFLGSGESCNDEDACTKDDICDGEGADVSHCSGIVYGCDAHGECNEDDNICTCELGYAGPNCEECAENFQDNDGDGSCNHACIHPLLPACIKDLGTCDDSSGVAFCLNPGFVAVAPGSFMMGTLPSEAGYQTNELQHEVTLTDHLEVMQTELTQLQWGLFMDILNPILTPAGFDPFGNSPSYHSCAQCPVERVSWTEAAFFADFLSTISGLEPCYIFTSNMTGVFNLGAGCSGPACDSGMSMGLDLS